MDAVLPKPQINLETVRDTGWEYTVALFYNYVHLDDPTQLMHEWRGVMTRLHLTGRVILATEGINVICGGTTESVAQFCEWLIADERFSNTHFKFSRGTSADFPRLSIKVRNEIVSLHLGSEDFHPSQLTGKRLSPEELHEWYTTGKKFRIIDMRNAYEHKIGHFVGSELPPLNNFRDLRSCVDSIHPGTADEPILTVCTGGVRCEKASGFLVKKGFQNVYQLDGGMVSYMEKYPTQNFVGGMYTFDGRHVIDWDNGQHEIIGKCEKCNTPCERLVDCLNMKCNRQYIGCESCDPDRKISRCTVCPENE